MPLPDNPSLPLIGTPGAAPAPPTAGARTPIADANYLILATDRYVALTSLTASRIWTLPLAAAFPVGTVLWLQDESGQITQGVSPLTVQIARSGSDTIDGLTTISMSNPYQGFAFECNGVNKWTYQNPNVIASFNTAPSRAVNVADRAIACACSFSNAVLTLPAANTFPAGVPIYFFDSLGNGGGFTTALARSGSDTINGGGANVIVINTAWGVAAVVGDGISAWNAVKIGGGGSSPIVQQVGDTNATIAAGTTIVLLTTALSAPRVLTMPAASGFSAGASLYIIDPKGVVTTTNSISIARAGTDTINGATANVVVLSGPRGIAQISLDNGATNWGTVGSIFLRAGGFNDMPLQFGVLNFGVGAYTPASTIAQLLFQTGNNAAVFSANGTAGDKIGIGMLSTGLLGFSSGSDPTGGTWDVALSRSAAGRAQINNGTAGTFRDLDLRSLLLDKTVTAGGTTGNQTINKAAGTVNIAAGSAAITVTNSLVAAGSIILCVIRTADATLTFIKSVVAGAGSFVITCNANATAETSIGFAIVA